MGEEEIIKKVEEEIEEYRCIGDKLDQCPTKEDFYKTADAIQALLDLYKQEKEKNKEAESAIDRLANLVDKQAEVINEYRKGI